MPSPPVLSDDLMRLAVDNLADAVTIHDANGNLLYANEATARMMGMTLEEVLSADPGAWSERFTMYEENGRELPLEELPGRRVFFGETPDPLLVRSVSREDGSWQWVRIKAAPVLDAEGHVTAAVNVSEEVTEVKEAELAQRLLAEAGVTLAASLDYEKTLQDVAQLAVPGFADWCGVELVAPDGGLDQVALAHVDPDKLALGKRMRERYPPDLEAENGLGAVLGGETVLWPEIPDELLVDSAQSEEHLVLLRAVGLRSVLMTALRFGDRVIGAMSFVLADRTFSPADLRLAEELAARAVTAIENSRLFTERARIARTLQEGLLPPTLEAPPGWETAVLFRAAGSANEVGGDFYDIIQLGDSWLSFVGDVAGKGAGAAALTARARYTMISVAQLTGRADSAVDRVNDAFLDIDGSSLCTLAALRLPGAEPGGQVEILSAGHPLPYLVTNDGAATPLGVTGPLLGFVRSPRWPHATAEVAPGEAIVLFSDGVLDTMSEDRRHFGEHRLVDVLRCAPVHSAAELVERLDRALLDFPGSEQRDDVAVLCCAAVDPATAGTYDRRMSLRPGTHELGPDSGGLEVKTYREGMAAKAGHDLIFDVRKWQATLEVGEDVAQSSLELSADPHSLYPREGVGGVKALTDKDRDEIVKNIEEKVLGGEPISFRSSAVEAADGGGLSVNGELTINGQSGPATFELSEGSDGHVTGNASLVQSEWGIKPYKGLMGALKVRDSLEVVFEGTLPTD